MNRVTYRITPVDVSTVERNPGVTRVMIHPRSRQTHQCRTHVTWHKDKGGYFVRLGKRGADKRYLTECEITSLDGRDLLWQFRTE